MRNKITVCLIFSFLLSGCFGQSSWSGYEAEEIEKLEAAGISESTAETCENPKSLVTMSNGKLEKKYVKQYCSENLAKANPRIVNAILKAGGTAKQAKRFGEVAYAWRDRASRYIAYDRERLSGKEVVLQVNLNLDKPYYTDVKTITDTSDITMLVNKYQKIPEDYNPLDLIETPSACTDEYSCFPDQQYVIKEAGENFAELVKAASKEGFQLTAIASLRDYQYQKMLYNYYANANGTTYADTYFARPGQSEHNTALAIDVTIDKMNYEEIEDSEYYPWLLKHMADYGFILRYPKDKEDVTGFGYESWHLRYVGKKTAKQIMSKGITLDEFHAMKVEEK